MSDEGERLGPARDARAFRSESARPVLPALDGLRWVAAFTIYVFHLVQAHLAGVMTLEVIDLAPAAVVRVLSHGHLATGLFFVLSGFLLTYVYANESGELKVSWCRFWFLRWLGLYPIYFFSLLLIAPLPSVLPIAKRDLGPFDLLGGVTTSLSLTQSWFPSWALFWNPPAWALSATVTFYAFFPWVIRWIGKRKVKTLQMLLGSLTVMSLLPALLFFAVDPEGNASSVTPVTLGGFWLAALRFHPLVWVGPFLSGVVLARLASLSIQSQGSRRPMVGRLIREGLAGESSARCPIDLTDIGEPTKTGWFWKPRLAWIDWMIILLLAGLSLPWSIPYVLSRHNLFLPLQLAIVWECAHGRGILSQLLSSPWLRRWSASSFPLFALQMPTGVWFAYLVLGTRELSWVALIAMMIVTIATSRIVATQFDRWISKPVRARLGPGKLPPSETKPYPGRWVDRRTEHPPLAQGGSGLA